MKPAVLSVAAKSGTGKTTLVVKLISELKQRGYRVGAVKHDGHGFSMDKEGKDSWRFTEAGSDITMVTSSDKIAMIRQNPDRQEPPLQETIARYFDDVDIVITEGFKKNDLPKIEVHRRECRSELLYRGENNDPNLLAVASDEPLVLDVPVFDLDDTIAICDLIETRLLS
ncbi:MAG: molybdopterin-guanine dinucleotide biosynthesis protein B [Syntrophotaleaceae bacterium]